MPIQFLDDNSATVSQPPVVPPPNLGSTAGAPRSQQSKIKFLDDNQQPATTADSLMQSTRPQSSLALLDNKTVVPPTAADLEGLMAEGYKPTDQDLRTIYADEKASPFLPKLWKGVKEGAVGIVKPFAKAPGEIKADPSLERGIASLGEGIVGAASGTVGMVAKPIAFGYRKLVQEPQSTDEENYERWRLNYLATHDVGVTPLPNSVMDSWVRAATVGGEDLPQKAIPQPYPNTSSAIGTLAALPMFEGASELSGLNKLLTVPKGNVSGKALGAAGATLRATGKAAETIGGAPEALAEGVSKKVLGEELSKKIGKAVNVGETPVALAELAIGHHATGGALAAAKILEKAGPGISEAGEFATRIAEANPASPFGRLFTVAKDSTAPEWMRALAGHWATRIAADTINAGATGLKAAAVGGTIGGGLSAISGDNPEDIGRNIGAGAALGTLTAGLAAPALRKARILQQTMASVDNLYQAHIAEGIDPSALKKVGNDAMTWAALGEQMFGDGTKIRFAPEGPNSPLPKGVYSQAGLYVPETKTAWINLSSNRDPAETVLHEIIHPIFDSGVANQPEIKQQIADQLAQTGKTPLQAKIQYVMRELAPTMRGLDPEAQKQAIAQRIQARDAASQSTTGDPDHWIYSEILAESAVQALYGTHPILDVTNPGLKSWALSKVQGALEGLGVKFNEKPSASGAGTILPDFKGVIDSQPLRKTVYALIKAQKEFLPGISEEPEHGTKITPEMWGNHPGATLEPQADGSKANDFVIQKPDGRIIQRTPRQTKKIVKTRQAEINAAYPNNPPAEVTDQSPGIKNRKTIGGVVERSGTELGPDFDQLQTFSPKTKGMAREIEQAIKDGGAFSGWYQQIGNSPEWKSSVQKNTGAIEAQYKDFIPYAFKVDKQGNLLVQNYSLTAFQRKAAKWALKHGPASLDLWGGDIGHFAKDVQLYLKNHAENLPGEANNIGVEKKNVINGFLVGGNRAFGEKNPLRAELKGEDRQGIVRSYRLDRLETLEPLQSDFEQPNYTKQVQNLSPQLEDVDKMNPTDFFDTASGWRNAAMQGQGKTVQELAEEASRLNPNREAWQAASDRAKADAKRIRDEVAAKPASMMERQKELMGAAQKSQFFQEALKKLPEQLSPDVPLTEAGKKLVEQGYRFETRENEDAGEGERSIKVSLYKGDTLVGGITARLPGENETIHGQRALIDGVKIDPKFRGQKLSEPLYRELATRLQQKGITSTTGFVVHPAPLKIRDRLFGEPTEKDVVEGSGTSGGFPTTYVTHELSPTAKFSPSAEERPEHITAAAVQDNTGKVWTGTWHGAEAGGALENALKDRPDLDPNGSDTVDGFVTSKGRFVDRDEALRIAQAAKQLGEPKSAEKERIYGDARKQPNLESQRFSNQRLFSPDVEDAFEQAKKFFGTTKNIREAGFALPDGTLLDLSGRHESKNAAPDQRTVEHREVYKLPALKEVSQTALNKRKGLTDLEAANDPALFESAGSALDEFMNRGAMRFDAAGGSAHFMSKPTTAQLNVLKQIGDSYGGQVTVDVEDGARKASFIGEARKVAGKIRRFYRGENFETEDTQQFSPTLAQLEAKWAKQAKAEKNKPPVDEAWQLRSGKTKDFSKMWILPNGTPMQLGSTWHHQAINDNPALRKKYGLSVSESSEDNRIEALQKGFSRVNYDEKSGHLIVEARKKDWEKLAPAVVKLVQSNAGKIDSMTVNLLDAKVKRVVESDNKRMFDLADSEKVQNIPLMGGETPTIDFSPQASSQLSPDTRKPNEDVRANAADYMATAKLPYAKYEEYRDIDAPYSRASADFYQTATHNPKDPAVQAAYAAFGKETVNQWKHLTDLGVEFEPWTQPGQPYANSAEMTKDVREQRHLWFFPTESGFGGEEGLSSEHPLLAGSGIFLNGKELLLNDIFRAVHDYYGHAKEGYEFGPRGEYNAFLAHSRMYSKEALPAMAMETHGQNSWVNFGPHMRDAEGNLIQKGQPGYLPITQRPYAEQKANLFPVALEKLSPNIDEAAEKVAEETLKQGGSTYNIADNKPVGRSAMFGVSLYPERSVILDPNELNADHIRQFIVANADLLKDKHNNVGTWFDKDSGKVYLDVTVGVPDRNLAVFLGQQTNQKAIWDSAQAREINTGGTGEPVPNLPPAPERFQTLQKTFQWQNERPSHAFDSRFKKQGMFSPDLFSRSEMNPMGENPENIKDSDLLLPDKELTPTELAASNLARKELRNRVQLLPDVGERVKLRRAIARGFAEVSDLLDKQMSDKSFDSGADWYRKDLDTMEEITKKLFPETKQAEKMTIFKALLAALSGGARPKENYQYAAEAFANYLKSGEFSGSSPYRVNEKGVEKQLGRQGELAADKLNKLLQETGGEKQLADYLLTKHDKTIYGNEDAYGALDLGPKFGRFFLNMTGHADEVTVDLWATRTFNRWMGTPFRQQAGKAVLPDVPTDEERNIMIRAFNEIGDKISKETGVELSAMDVQAVLWYYEKDLYSELATVDRNSFGNAAKSYAENPLHTQKSPKVVPTLPPRKASNKDLTKGTEALQLSPMMDLDTMAIANRNAVARSRAKEGTLGARESSYLRSRGGIVLHSAGKRSTLFISGNTANSFEKKYQAAQTPQAKNKLIESYFTQ